MQEENLKLSPKQRRKKALAHHAMNVYAKIYQIQRKMKVEKRSFEEIKSIRQEKTLPLLNNFKQWCDEKQALVPQKSPIAKAINYTLRHWDGLARFCEDGRYLIDNNHTEREIKPFVIARKKLPIYGKSARRKSAMPPL